MGFYNSADFPGLESHEIEVWVMESHRKAIYFPRKKVKRSKVEIITEESETRF